MPTDVSDAAWALLTPLLHAAQAGRRPRTTDLRAVIHAISYLLRTSLSMASSASGVSRLGPRVSLFPRNWKSSGVLDLPATSHL